MGFETAAFMLFAVGALVGALAVVQSPNVMHGVVGLFITVVMVGGMYFLLDASFVGAVQLMVYAGGIVVLIAFVVMLVRRITGEDVRLQNRQVPFGLFVCASFIVWSVYVIRSAFLAVEPVGSAESAGQAVAVEDFARRLITDYLLPFEIASVLLLVAMVGAVLLTGRGPGRRRIRPSGEGGESPGG